MTIREDMLRVLAYGKDAYARAIREYPSYAAELARTARDFQGRTWIDFSGFLPKFTTREYNKRREAYQAKYGTEINIPGFNDIIHIIPKAKITTEEMAAHKWAMKRGLPSPLGLDKLQLLKAKKYRFLKSLASPTPTWLRTYGSVATAMDNTEDALITLYWTGRLAMKIAPRFLGRLSTTWGWLLIGSDVLNLANAVSWAGAMTRGCKSFHDNLQSKNPFHAKYKAEHAIRLKQRTPGFGAFLEILQTTDQLFGVGLCLGGLFGLVQDTALKAIDPNYWLNLNRMLASGNVNEIAGWAAEAALNDFNSIKTGLKQEFIQLRDEAYRLKAWDQVLREGINKWIRTKSDAAWDWMTTPPEEASEPFNDVLISSMILNTGMQEFTKDQHTKSFMFLNQAMNGVMPWWYENDPIKNMPDIMNWKFRAPRPKDPSTIHTLDESLPNWQQTVKWPHLETEYATWEEIAVNYSSRIKESFQTYCMAYQHEYPAMAAAFECTDFIKNVILTIDDNHEVRCGMTAYLAAGIDMMDSVHIIPPDTPRQIIDGLSEYIGDYERHYGEGPHIKDIIAQGEAMGIEWMNQFPRKTFDKVAELFPEWREIQDELGEIYVAD